MLVLIILSTVIAITSHTLEIFKEKEEKESKVEQQAKETLKTVKRTEELLFEINRGLHPIQNVHAGYWIDIPTNHVKLKPYLTRFYKEAKTTVSQLENDERVKGIVGGGLNRDRDIRHFDLNLDSSLFPNKRNEKLANIILSYAEIELQFYKTPISINEHPNIGGDWSNKPDLKISVGSELSRLNDEQGHSVEYNIEKQTFSLNAHMIRSDPKYWESTGKIIGIPDLLGAQVFIRLPSIVISGHLEVDQFLPEIRKGFQLRTLILNFSNGREFWLTKKELKLHYEDNGLPIYVYEFPKTAEKLAAMSR